MRRSEAELAMTIGIETVRAAADRGVRAIALGEIGIGNTTAAAALTSALTGEPPARKSARAQPAPNRGKPAPWAAETATRATATTGKKRTIQR